MDNIQKNGFSLGILNKEGWVNKIIYRSNKFYVLQNSTMYVMKISNNHDVICVVDIFINNKHIGIYRINPFSEISITRSIDIAMFRDLKSNINNTSIKLVFRLEKETPYRLVNSTDLLNNSNKCCDIYTDTVTPYTTNNRCYSVPGSIYHDKMELLYTESRKPKLIDHNRYLDIDNNSVTTISIMMIADDDITTWYRKYNMMKPGSYTQYNAPKLDDTHSYDPYNNNEYYYV